MENGKRPQQRRKGAKMLTSSALMVVLALLIFVAAVGIGVQLLSSKPAAASGSSSSSSSSSSQMSSSSKPSSSSVASSSSSQASSSSSSSSSVASSSTPSSSSSTASSSSSSSSSTATQTMSFSTANYTGSGFSNIAGYKQINADVKGWLKVPGTNINYPVLHNANDVYYYLDKDIYKQKSRDGVIYAGPTVRFGKSDAISKNTVLFGHNWTNVSANPRIGSTSDVMFAQLTSYHHLSFAQAYPYVYYSTDSQEMTWVVFAAFYTDIGFNYIEPNPTDASFTEIVNGARSRSRHNFAVEVASTDKIVTLSTCTRAYGSSDQQRFVVMARMLRPGETIKEVTVTANPNPVLPRL